MTDLMGYWSVICSTFRLMISLENLLVSGVDMALIWALFALYFYDIGLSEALPYSRRGGVSAAQAEATSDDVKIVL